MNEQPKYSSACLEAEQLVAWFDDALPSDEAHAVQMHLATCAYCSRHVNELMEERQQVFGLLTQLDPPPAGHTTSTTAALARFQEHVSQSGNDNMSLESTPLTRLRRERPRFSRVAMQTLVAALIIAVLVGTILSLLIPRVASPGSALEPFPPLSTTPVAVHTEAGGLSMSMQLTAGPYFLNEMLQINLSISNHTTSSFWLSGWEEYSLCGRGIKIVMQGGTPPSDTTLEHNLTALLCVGSPSLDPLNQFKPGQTFTARQYVVLTRSGPVQLTAQSMFWKEVPIKDGRQWTPISTPLSGHWPTIGLNVSPHVPTQRTILLKQQNPSSVTVVVPPATHPQLLYIEQRDCGSLGQNTVEPIWQPLSGTTLHILSCMSASGEGPLLSWTYIIGAPGLATQFGTYRPKT